MMEGVTQPSRNEKSLVFRQGFEILARPAGFEPTTPWFVARYSIHLSYGREEARIITVFPRDPE
jgi:hypothetical protein